MSQPAESLSGEAPGVAVVIACFNLGRTLQEAVDSALDQTRAPSEIVVVDDGSTDPETARVLAQLRSPGTRVLTAGHAGVASARNLGACATKAPYLVFLDADDRLAPDYVDKTASRLDRGPSLSFVSCAVQAFEGASYVWKPAGCDALTTLTHGSVHISSLMRRTLWDAAGGFDTSLAAYEDLDFWLRASRLGFRGEVLDEALLFYRVRPDSRYRRGIEPATYRRVMSAIVEKHRDFVEAAGLDVLRSKEAFLAGLAEYGASLRRRHAAAAGELASLDAGAASARRARRADRPGGLILAYHRVAALEPDTHRLCVPEARFRAHVQHLAATCAPMPLADLVRAAQQGSLPARAVAVTLDDGYLDALTAAAPILAEHAVPATFFVNSDCLDEEHEAWHDVVERILLSGGALPPVLDFPVGGEVLHLDVSTPDARRGVLMDLHGRLLQMAASERREALDRLAAWSGMTLEPRRERRLLLGAEIRALARVRGCRIGSHSASHLLLTAQTRAVQMAELRGCREALETLLGQPVRAFCYPFGEHDDELVRVVGESGYELAVTIDAGLVTAGSDPLRLPRYEIGDCPVDEFAALIDRAFGGEAANAPRG